MPLLDRRQSSVPMSMPSPLPRAPTPNLDPPAPTANAQQQETTRSLDDLRCSSRSANRQSNRYWTVNVADKYDLLRCSRCCKRSQVIGEGGLGDASKTTHNS